MLRYVDVEALNFRSQPVVSAATRVAILHLGQPVELLGPARRGRLGAHLGRDRRSAAGWLRQRDAFCGRPCRTPGRPWSRRRCARGCASRRGWARSSPTRSPGSSARCGTRSGSISTAAIATCRGRPRRSRSWCARPAWSLRATGGSASPRPMRATSTMRSCGAMPATPARRSGAFACTSTGPRSATWSAAGARRRAISTMRRRQDAFKSHCDIIVRITADDLLAIGGNVAQSVSITRYQLTQSGFLADADQVFAHLVNRV